MSESEKIEELKEAIPENWQNKIGDYNLWSGGVRIGLTDESVIGGGLTSELLKNGWVVTSQIATTPQAKYLVRKFDIEEREVKSTETVAVLDKYNE